MKQFFSVYKGGILFLTLISFFVNLNSQPYRKAIYQAYISDQMDLWEKSLQDQLSASLEIEKSYDLAMDCYGFIGYCIWKDQKERGRPYLDHAEQLAGTLLKKNPEDPRYVALRGALYGFRIGYQPQKVMIIGPKALKTVNRAVNLGPECPQAWIEAGNKDWWMPAIFGGSRVRAVEEYEKAILMMEKDTSFIKNNWYYLNVHMILAGCCKELNMTFRSREIYRKLLNMEPRFNWAREMLAK